LLARPGRIAPPAAPPNLSALRKAALTSHPDLRRFEARLAASRSRVDLAAKDFYPDVRLMTGYSGLWDEPEKRFTVGVAINLPWNRDKYRQIQDAAQANTMRAMGAGGSPGASARLARAGALKGDRVD